jgi:hypothetical protein
MRWRSLMDLLNDAHAILSRSLASQCSQQRERVVAPEVCAHTYTQHGRISKSITVYTLSLSLICVLSALGRIII